MDWPVISSLARRRCRDLVGVALRAVVAAWRGPWAPQVHDAITTFARRDGIGRSPAGGEPAGAANVDGG
jgi:hypothetical protein